ncbi:unnamed protein product, partial [Mesorhabditis spiculigera]
MALTEDYEYLIYGNFRLLFLVLECLLLIPTVYICTRVVWDTILFFVVAVSLPILIYDIMKIIKNGCMFIPHYEHSLQPIFIQIDYFLHNLIHITFVICTEVYFLHHSLSKYKYDWAPFAISILFAGFLAACTCFIDSIITNLFIVGFTTGTISAMILMSLVRKLRANIEGHRQNRHTPMEMALFSVYATTPYTLNGLQFLLSFVSIIARAKADSGSEFGLWDESVHAYAAYLMELRPLAILSPIFIWIPHFRDHFFGAIKRILPKELEDVEVAKRDRRMTIRLAAFAIQAIQNHDIHE